MRYFLVILTVLLLVSVTDSEAQRKRKRSVNKGGVRSVKTRLRHVEGIKFVEGFGGFSGSGVFAEAAGGMFFYNSMAFKVNASYEEGNVFDVQIRRIMADIQYGYTIYAIEGIAFFSMYGGLTGSMDRASTAEVLEVDEKINFGVVISPELEIFILQNISLFARTNQRIMFNNNFGMFRNYSGVGLRLNFR